jgi:hypothetical protein
MAASSLEEWRVLRRKWEVRSPPASHAQPPLSFHTPSVHRAFIPRVLK